MSSAEPRPAPATLLPAVRRRPDLVDFLLSADVAGASVLIEAGELYGEDADRELADIEAGRHPAQRSPRP